MEMGRQAPSRIRAMVLSSINAKPAPPSEAAIRKARIADAYAGMAEYARIWARKSCPGGKSEPRSDC
jgi:hypothetical protein